MAAFYKCGTLQQNIEFIKAACKKADTESDTPNMELVIKVTMYASFKPHLIMELSRIYKGGDKGGTTYSANSATTDDIAAQFAG